MSNQFKPPRKVLSDITDKTQTINGSTESTEEDMSNETLEAIAIEDMVRNECQNWLAFHGSKLFSLEASKFNSQEAKRKNLRSAR